MSKSKQLDFTGKTIYVGLDVHRKDWKVCILLEELVYKQFCQPPKPKILGEYLRKHFPGGTYKSVYEAGFCGFWIHEELTAEGIEREVHKMHSKTSSFEKNCAAVGLSLRHVYAASLQCQKMFLDKKGEFYWFFRKMKLVERRGSFLFLHAGLDDAMSELLLKNGTTYANKAFHRNLKHMDLFGFYYSSIANTFRTKYRDADLPLTERGVNAVHKAGIHFVVQGHVNRQEGQRIAIKKGLIHIEADITLDENSRKNEGLESFGIGATLIGKKQGLIGISCDYPTAKVLKPQELGEIYE